ncbi:phosphotransferase [Virgibacillus sp. 7505]|uniref:phosphotransferase family protein n=1 Tax=Virgibacillus sp. 7505 TaxID=2022548 RepID=UPI002570FB7D|nr:phosphotransferase [Virgibacillus sp. 7505]
MMAGWLESYLQEAIWHVETIDMGWDHDVYVLNNSWVLRVPKKSETVNQEEKKLLKDLQVKTNIALPAFTILTTPKGSEAVLYPYIPGHPISANMSDIVLEGAASQLGAFLSKLHQLDASMYRLPERDKSYYDRLQEGISSFYPSLPAFVINYTERLFAELEPVCTAVVHGDLRSAHILWEESSCRVGIIDFSDMHVGDPAIDFAGISEISKVFLQQVLCAYEADDKEKILRRAEQLSKLGLYYELFEYGPNSKLLAEMENRFV